MLPDCEMTAMAGPKQPSHVAKENPSAVVTPSRETHVAVTPGGVSLAGQGIDVPTGVPLAETVIACEGIGTLIATPASMSTKTITNPAYRNCMALSPSRQTHDESHLLAQELLAQDGALCQEGSCSCPLPLSDDGDEGWRPAAAEWPTLRDRQPGLGCSDARACSGRASKRGNDTRAKRATRRVPVGEEGGAHPRGTLNGCGAGRKERTTPAPPVSVRSSRTRVRHAHGACRGVASSAQPRVSTLSVRVVSWRGL